jgi:recombinational DNA repair protein (RecF pathway)
LNNMKELCIRCGKETEYDINAPITLRHYYVEGSGQLCSECWRELYGKEALGNANVRFAMNNSATAKNSN